MRRPGAILFVVAAFVLPSIQSAQAQQPRLYRYTDEHGVVRYTDKIPAEDADRDRNILNEQGVRVGFQEGALTDDERAVIAERERAAEAERLARIEIARRDRMLLETYASVTDIEELRDRRLVLLESQIKVTELYLGNLRKRLTGLQEEASVYKPYTVAADAPQIPENLALDLSRTSASITLYEKTLARTRADQAALRESFDKDIARFRELKDD